MGFFGQGVWIIGYRGLMGYGMGIPAYQSRRITPLWGFGGYGLFTLWVMRGSTVPSKVERVMVLSRLAKFKLIGPHDSDCVLNQAQSMLLLPHLALR